MEISKVFIVSTEGELFVLVDSVGSDCISCDLKHSANCPVVIPVRGNAICQIFNDNQVFKKVDL